MATEPPFISDPVCEWCKQPASRPGTNDRGEPCPCRCHKGTSHYVGASLTDADITTERLDDNEEQERDQ